ncbi:MAG: 4,5-DOPA dioxygenase extradiol [Vicinamibacterales bacterium]
MPLLFVGHGSPMNALEDNRWSRGFRSMASLLPTPRAIVSVSAHWWTPGTFVTGNERPETIHDFGGFPRALYEMHYPAPGDVALARRIATLLERSRAEVRLDWGLDHGTWSVLHHLRPGADVPVVQVSLDGRLAPEGHIALGRTLASLRDEGVLIMGSGNVTHNLRHAMSTLASGDVASPDWATTFDTAVARALEDRDMRYLAGALDRNEGRLSHPTPDHYFPLLYVAGAATTADEVRFPVTGFDLSSLSMRSVLIG